VLPVPSLYLLFKNKKRKNKNVKNVEKTFFASVGATMVQKLGEGKMARSKMMKASVW